MTCILAMVYQGKVHMVGDKQGSNGFKYANHMKSSKVFKRGQFIMGYTTSFRMGQLLQFTWVPPTKSADDTDDQYLFTKVIDSILKCFKDNDFGYKEKANWQGGNFLIGWRGRLFEMQPEMSLLEYEDFASVGCGEYHALAAMKTMGVFGCFSDDPKNFLASALEVAASCVHGISNEHDYLHED